MATIRKVAETPGFDTDADGCRAPHRVGNSSQHSKSSKRPVQGCLVVVVATMLLMSAAVYNLALETEMLDCSSDSFLLSDNVSISSNDSNISINISSISGNTSSISGNSSSSGAIDESACSPTVANASDIVYHSGHRYYSILEEMTPLPPPVFHDDHSVLCNATSRNDLGFGYCLPISGRKDTPFCTGADRMDLLTQHSNDMRCYASVLHMLLVEVYEELQAFGKAPLVVFGSLLGAARNGSMIPFTEDADLSYSGQLREDGELSLALMKKGFHFFFRDIWRVCVSPTHPLAVKLYDPKLPITDLFTVPYLDLYALEKLNDTHWSLEEFGDSLLPDDKVHPFSQVTINGLPFDTVHDPNYFLEEMYGDDYMTPNPRY